PENRHSVSGPGWSVPDCRVLDFMGPGIAAIAGAAGTAFVAGGNQSVAEFRCQSILVSYAGCPGTGCYPIAERARRADGDCASADRANAGTCACCCRHAAPPGTSTAAGAGTRWAGCGD